MPTPLLLLAVVEAVDVYALLCALAGVTPAPNDGSIEAFRHILR